MTIGCYCFPIYIEFDRFETSGSIDTEKETMNSNIQVNKLNLYISSFGYSRFDRKILKVIPAIRIENGILTKFILVKLIVFSVMFSRFIMLLFCKIKSKPLLL